MTDFETKVRESVAALSYDLEGYAARAAMLELADNWRAALGAGAKPAILVTDLDQVIEKLGEIRRRIHP